MCDQLLLLPGEIESPIHLAKQSLSVISSRRVSAAAASPRRLSLSGPPNDERNVRGTLAFVPVASASASVRRALSRGDPLIRRNVRLSSRRNLARNPRDPRSSRTLLFFLRTTRAKFNRPRRSLSLPSLCLLSVRAFYPPH